MVYNQPVELKFSYKGDEVIFYVAGEVGVNLEISCSHETFIKKFRSSAFLCATSYSLCLLPETLPHPDYEFFHSMVKVMDEKLKMDFDKQPVQ